MSDRSLIGEHVPSLIGLSASLYGTGRTRVRGLITFWQFLLASAVPASTCSRLSPVLSQPVPAVLVCPWLCPSLSHSTHYSVTRPCSVPACPGGPSLYSGSVPACPEGPPCPHRADFLPVRLSLSWLVPLVSFCPDSSACPLLCPAYPAAVPTCYYISLNIFAPALVCCVLA